MILFRWREAIPAVRPCWSLQSTRKSRWSGHPKAEIRREAGNRVRSVVNGTVSTVAGDGTAGFKDGAAATARFNLPRGIAVDSFGKIYVADSFNYRVRVISNGVVSTVAGDGVQGILDGAGTAARFFEPASLAVSADGKTIYVGDEYGHRVRVISVGP